MESTTWKKNNVTLCKWFVDYMNENHFDDEPKGDQWSIDYCVPFNITDYKSEILLECPENLKKYVDTDQIINDEWNNDEIYIIYTDNTINGDVFCRLEDIRDLYPIWKNKEWKYFEGHPMREAHCTIIWYQR